MNAGLAPEKAAPVATTPRYATGTMIWLGVKSRHLSPGRTPSCSRPKPNRFAKANADFGECQRAVSVASIQRGLSEMISGAGKRKSRMLDLCKGKDSSFETNDILDVAGERMNSVDQSYYTNRSRTHSTILALSMSGAQVSASHAGS